MICIPTRISSSGSSNILDVVSTNEAYKIWNLYIRYMRAWKYLKMIDEWSSSPILRKTISEPQTGIEPATFWWSLRRSNHWPTQTQMASQGASSTYMCDLIRSHYILIMIDEICILHIWELGNILRWQMNDRQALYSEKQFLSPRRGSNPQLSDDRKNVWPLSYQDSDGEPRCKFDVQLIIYHIYLGSSMVRACNQSSEGCGFDLRLGLRNRFLEYKAWRSFIYHLKIFPSSHISNIQISSIIINILWLPLRWHIYVELSPWLAIWVLVAQWT